MTRPACTSSCDQGRKPCPCPMACQTHEGDDHGPDDMVFNPCGWIVIVGYLLIAIGLAVLVYMRVTA